jgi:hypothetical protein
MSDVATEVVQEDDLEKIEEQAPQARALGRRRTALSAI